MNALEEFRKEIKKFNLTQLARKADITRRSLIGWVQGNSPTFESAQRVAEAMGKKFILVDKE